RFERKNMEANKAFVDLLAKVAKEKNATTAQVALAWVLAQKPWIVPIPGTTKIERMDENAGAADLQLTPRELFEIHQSASMIKAEGERYPENLQKTIDREE
ncbi:Aldo/keto reductase, partial [mine drainage metagenome]